MLGVVRFFPWTDALLGLIVSVFAWLQITGRHSVENRPRFWSLWLGKFTYDDLTKSKQKIGDGLYTVREINAHTHTHTCTHAYTQTNTRIHAQTHTYIYISCCPESLVSLNPHLFLSLSPSIALSLSFSLCLSLTFFSFVPSRSSLLACPLDTWRWLWESFLSVYRSPLGNVAYEFVPTS